MRSVVFRPRFLPASLQAGTMHLNHGWTRMDTDLWSEPVSSSRNNGGHGSVILIFSGGVWISPLHPCPSMSIRVHPWFPTASFRTRAPKGRYHLKKSARFGFTQPTRCLKNYTRCEANAPGRSRARAANNLSRLASTLALPDVSRAHVSRNHPIPPRSLPQRPALVDGRI